MSIFSDNIRYLRSKREKSQRELAEDLIITRDRYSKYEEDKSDPPLDILQRISRYHHVSIDILLSVDLRKIPIDNLLKLDDNRILLPITVDRHGDDFIEVVPLKAKAGYVAGYGDPVFIESLPQISFPSQFIGFGKHRAFPIDGDSMPPHNNTTYIVGRYVENLEQIKKGKTYIILTVDDGIVYKRIGEKSDSTLTVTSDNADYKSYEIKRSDILEIWEFACSLNMKEAEPYYNDSDTLENLIRQTREDIQTIMKKLD